MARHDIEPARPRQGAGARRRAALAALLALVLPISARAQTLPCSDVIPGNCQLQVQAPITYRGWQTQGWAYYCTGSHPYYWGFNWGIAGAYDFDNSCFSVAENPFAESGDTSKFDATITNWCVTTQQITVTLPCSDRPQVGGAAVTAPGGSRDAAR